MSESNAFRYFLTEYKKRLPITDENKNFHEHIDYMIDNLKSSSRVYQKRWNDWISPDDERYWRLPNESEKRIIEINREKEKTVTESNKTRDAIVIMSCIIALIGCWGNTVSAMRHDGIDYYGLVLFSVFIAQGVLTILNELGIIKTAIWGWLY